MYILQENQKQEKKKKKQKKEKKKKKLTPANQSKLIAFKKGK